MTLSFSPRLVVAVSSLVLVVSLAAAPADSSLRVGAARVDITPEMPIRLAGYQSRAVEAERVESRLFARALAFGTSDRDASVIITAEIIGVSEEISNAVAAAIRAKYPQIPRANVAVCTTHVHTGPAIAGVLPFMYSADLPPDQQARIQRYTDSLQAKLIEVALAALAARQPGSLGWAEGKVGFATHRRVVVEGKWKAFGSAPDGPVDHALPVMRAADARGSVRAVLLNYACHCTTLGGNDNFVHSDWAGDAARRIEEAHAGAVALVAIGCGADANPNLRAIAGVAENGEKVAVEVARLLRGPLRPLGPVTTASYRTIELELGPLPTRAELVARTDPKERQTVSYAAKKFLEQLDAGKLPKAIPYPVQTWRFGRDLAMVFLAGEVVSEYSLRLKKELDGTRLWVNAYANSVPTYVASKRMFPEGGYEVDNSMNYYGWATRLSIDTEDHLIGTVRDMLGSDFNRSGGSSK